MKALRIPIGYCRDPRESGHCSHCPALPIDTLRARQSCHSREARGAISYHAGQGCILVSRQLRGPLQHHSTPCIDHRMSPAAFVTPSPALSRAIQREAGSRMLVDAFLLRVAAMSEEKGLLLIFPEYVVPITQLRGPDDTIAVAGKLDYLLVLLSEHQKNDAGEYPLCTLTLITYTHSRQPLSLRIHGTLTKKTRKGLQSWRLSRLYINLLVARFRKRSWRSQPSRRNTSESRIFRHRRPVDAELRLVLGRCSSTAWSRTGSSGCSSRSHLVLTASEEPLNVPRKSPRRRPTQGP